MIKTSLFHKIDEFIRYQHAAQCEHLLGDKFEHIHRKMDGKGGWYHRKRGHSRDFISQFRGKEKEAACIHLLGDCILDRLYESFIPVLEEIKKNNIEPPYFSKKRGSPKWFWDIDEKNMEYLMAVLGRMFIKTLKNKTV